MCRRHCAMYFVNRSSEAASALPPRERHCAIVCSVQVATAASSSLAAVGASLTSIAARAANHLSRLLSRQVSNSPFFVHVMLAAPALADDAAAARTIATARRHLF